ncbi:MAG TPA: polyprenyl synthetase family protein [Longimicrobiales bacterium]|nr:polyprenyl synthetase family protein [Longimicrobiales bacterium]
MTGAILSPAISTVLAEEARRADAAMQTILRRTLGRPASALDAVLRYGTLWGGKRLRPALCVCSHRAAGGDDHPGVYEIASALEFIHAYSLLHDDLPCMDDDDLRRGRPAAHRVFGVPATLLAGAALIPIACAAVTRAAQVMALAPGRASLLVRTLTRAAGAGGMIGGQVLDLGAEGRAASVAKLHGIHSLKTGALLSAAAEMGALAAGAEPAVVRACSAYGLHVGLAFQIADDVLEATSDAEALGKPVDGDASLAKSTFAALLGVSAAREHAREQAEEARAALAAAGIEDPTLCALADYAVERDQ